jgi:hypothetical protein
VHVRNLRTREPGGPMIIRSAGRAGKAKVVIP